MAILYLLSVFLFFLQLAQWRRVSNPSLLVNLKFTE